MTYIQSISSFVLRLGFGISALCAFLSLGVITLVPRTIAEGEAINDAFLEASGFIESELRKEGHLPSGSAFDAWKSGKSYLIGSMELILEPTLIPPAVVKEFGAMPLNGYAFSTSDGESMEYFISWRGESTVASSASIYASAFGPILAFTLLAWLLWKMHIRLIIRNSSLGGAPKNAA
jgi:hypothetical protein